MKVINMINDIMYISIVALMINFKLCQIHAGIMVVIRQTHDKSQKLNIWMVLPQLKAYIFTSTLYNQGAF